MTRMRTVDAAVRILEIEGATQAFGLPGAAINPFYSAMRAHGGIKHVLARHVEAASHMAEGFTRAAAGNIGVCIGTSGPAGTDMITGLYSASADSIPILAITGQAPVARLHKEDFQAVDIAAIAAPVTKMAMTVLEPGQVPGAFAQAFHLMRSGRPGPVLIDLPIDVQLAEIDFDPEAYQPLPVYKPAASRAQAAKAIDMLASAERPLIVAGGGIINADASDLLVELAEILNVPVVPTLMGWGSIPDDHGLAAGMVGLQTSIATATRPCSHPTSSSESATGGPTATPVGWTPTARDGVSFTSTSSRHRSAASSPPISASFRTRRRRSSSSWPSPRSDGRRHAAGLEHLGRGLPARKQHDASQDPLRRRSDQAATRVRGNESRLRPRCSLCHRDRAVTDRRRTVPACVQAAELDQLRSGGTARVDGARRPRRARRRSRRQGGRAVGRL